MDSNKKDPMKMINDFFTSRPKNTLLGSIDDYFKQSFAPSGFPVWTDETDTGFIVKAELPGVEKENIHLEIMGEELIITVKSDKKETRSGKQSIPIPPSFLKRNLKANYRNGVLKITIPRKPSTKIDIDF
ncbi:Hsp20/alpha crystallin family protein [Metabacillus idriensis]|uniref:Hsp20/alpha crystallin family protein n=1 Tax=Metabacillus idriensis TaxID=324768 RepID=UPI00174EC463|nr:Hsp20/alpha crystallin family protein [Metabacillus idriensis]